MLQAKLQHLTWPHSGHVQNSYSAGCVVSQLQNHQYSSAITTGTISHAWRGMQGCRGRWGAVEEEEGAECTPPGSGVAISAVPWAPTAVLYRQYDFDFSSILTILFVHTVVPGPSHTRLVIARQILMLRGIKKTLAKNTTGRTQLRWVIGRVKFR